MAKSIFPQDMMKSSGSEMSLEGIISKLTYFENQIQLIHWQTLSHAEHSALNFYDYLHDFKDEVVEKLMGYMGKRPKAPKVMPVTDGIISSNIVSEVIEFAHQLMEWAESNNYCDVENMAQSLSGEAAKTKYLLTQS